MVIELSALTSAYYLAITPFGAADVDLGALTTADYLTLTGGGTWNVPALTSVSTRLTVGDVPLPALTTAVDITVVGDAELPALASVSGFLLIQYGSPQVSYPALTWASELEIMSDATVHVAMPALAAIGPSPKFSPVGLMITGAIALQSVDMPALTTVDGPLTLTDNPQWCNPGASALVNQLTTITGPIDVDGC